jgi:hypothetical protein
MNEEMNEGIAEPAPEDTIFAYVYPRSMEKAEVMKKDGSGKMEMAWKRPSNRKIVGIVIAQRVRECDDTVVITGSLCHKTKDKFDKKIALLLAKERASLMANEGRNCKLPLSMQSYLVYMEERAKRYFKDCTKFVCSDLKPLKPIKQEIIDHLVQLNFGPKPRNIVESEARMADFCEEKKLNELVNSLDFQEMKKKALSELVTEQKG